MLQQFSAFVIQHWLLFGAFIGLLLLIALNEFLSKKHSPKMLSTAAVVELINQGQATIVDIRPQEAFTQGHITNAIRIAPEEKQKFAPYKTKSIVLVCMKGITANTLAMALKKEGFTDAMVLSGGMTAWQAAGLPTIKGKK